MYYTIVLFLDAEAVCRVDATCKKIVKMNTSHIGPWRELGGHMFRGLELEPQVQWGSIKTRSSQM